LSVIILAISCTSDHNSDYTAEQKQFITDINTLIAQVAVPLSQSEIQTRFSAAGGPLVSAKYIMFGEKHTDVPTLIDQARAIEALISPNDIILFESAPAGQDRDCDLNILDIFVMQKWNATGKAYNPAEVSEFSVPYTHMFSKTKKELHLANLKVHSAKCQYWDNPDANKLSPDLKALSVRNATMIGFAAKVGVQYNHVFILAGILHLPSGDLDLFKSDYGSSPALTERYFKLNTEQVNALNLVDYYQVVQAATDSFFLNLASIRGHGSTQEIHDFLRNQDYIELIPVSLLKQPPSCGANCD